MVARPTCGCGECKKCKHREYMNRWYRKPGSADRVRGWAKRYREANLERVREYDKERGNRSDRAKAKARSVVNTAIANGRLERKPCESCGISDHRGGDGRTLIQAHHDDYSKPLDVRWLCVACHAIEHRKVA